MNSSSVPYTRCNKQAEEASNDEPDGSCDLVWEHGKARREAMWTAPSEDEISKASFEKSTD